MKPGAEKTALPSYTTTGVTMGESVFTRVGGSMAAEVLDGVRVRNLFHEVSYMEGAPQVHLHFLTDDAEFRRDGYGTLELCCHGCGDAQLVRYNEPRSTVRVRDLFRAAHRKCLNRGYENKCPEYRRSVAIIDLRVRKVRRSARPKARRRARR